MFISAKGEQEMSFGIMGGADGPTSVFLAGKFSPGGFFNWINFSGLMIVILLLIPNILYAVRNHGAKNMCGNRVMNLLEQTGRYGSMLFMVLCVQGTGFGFRSIGAFLCYFLGNITLLLVYWGLWILYFVAEGKSRVEGFAAGKRLRLKMALAVVPSMLFLLSGVTLRYPLLIVCAVLFAAGHIYVTWVNAAVG